MAQKQRKAKDLDPKSRAKKVKGGYTSLGTHLGRTSSRTGTHVDRTVEGVGEGINETGKAFNRAMNPPQ